MSKELTVISGAARPVTQMVAVPLTQPSPYVRPVRINYTLGTPGTPPSDQNTTTTDAGLQRTWDLIEPMDSVAILVYHSGLHAFLLARQLRPAVLYSEHKRRQGVAPGPGTSTAPPSERDLAALAAAGAGTTYELCGGLCDKPGLPLEQVAAEEVEEELGFRVEPDRLRRLFDFPEAVGVFGARLTVFYVSVSDGNRVGAGGGLAAEGEAIEVVALPARANPVRAFLADASLVKSIDLQHALLLQLTDEAGPISG